MNITFTTRAIPAEGQKPAVPTQIITARPKVRPGRGEKWWSFDLLRDGVAGKVYIAVAEGLDLQEMMKETAEYLLGNFRDESYELAGLP